MVWAHEHSYERLYPVYNRKVNFHFAVCLFVCLVQDHRWRELWFEEKWQTSRWRESHRFFSRYLSIFCDPELNRHITKLFLGNFYCTTAAHPPWAKIKKGLIKLYKMSWLRKLSTVKSLKAGASSVSPSSIALTKRLSSKLQLLNCSQWPICDINSVDITKLSCYTLPPTQHHSFFSNLPSKIKW